VITLRIVNIKRDEILPSRASRESDMRSKINFAWMYLAERVWSHQSFGYQCHVQVFQTCTRESINMRISSEDHQVTLEIEGLRGSLLSSASSSGSMHLADRNNFAAVYFRDA